MRSTSNRLSAGRAVCGTFCLVLAVVGCTPQSTLPQSRDATAATPTASDAPTATDTPVTVAPEPAYAKEAVVPQAAEEATAPEPAQPAEETVEIGACDGGEAITVSQDLTGQALASSLMDQWKRDHPHSDWVAEQQERHALKPPADNSALLQGDQGEGHAYGNYTERDLITWTRETEKFVAEGSRIFHDADALGSTVAVSCDMCHPHASNTHPETYPKYQTQLGRVALLRDMINWCVENPVRGEKLEADSPTMRALEAYIQSQRKGVPMDYGKH